MTLRLIILTIFFYLFNITNTLIENGLINERGNKTQFFYRINKTKFSIDGRLNKNLEEEVDCFGLGSTVAQALEWFFQKNVSSSREVDVQFFFTSRRKPKRAVVIVGDQFGLDWTDFKYDRKTIFIVHGFLSNSEEQWIKDMEIALRLLEDVNVVVVDWSAHGNTYNYYKAVVNAKKVGQAITKLLSHVVNATQETISGKPHWGTIHMIGHSLGAHICGIAANEFKKLNTPWKVTRITGLDPAQPCFRDSRLSLHTDDAPFVDVIHTNGRLLSSIGLGLPNPIGHIDFYPNGGRIQPGCLSIQNSWLNTLGVPDAAIAQAVCSHGRSYLYLTESIRAAAQNYNCTFWGRSWNRSFRRAMQIMNETCNENNCIEMGIRAEMYPQRGSFFVLTSNVNPFCDINSRDMRAVKEELLVDFAHE